MAVVDFIEQDIARARPSGLLLALLGPAVALLCIVAAFTLREDFVGVLTWEYLTPPVLMLAALSSFPWLSTAAAQQREKLALAFFWTGAVLILLLSFAHPGFPFGTVYPSRAVFWQEAARCFVKGLGTSIAVGAILTTALLKLAPLPGRIWQAATALTAGFAGVAMLNLHCNSANIGHIIFGHWGPAVPVFALSLLWQRWIFRSYVKAALGPHSASTRQLGRLDAPVKSRPLS